MSKTRHSVCLIAGGLDGPNWPLQPWRYLTEIARQLAVLGHPVSVITDGAPSAQSGIIPDEIGVRRLISVRSPVWKPNGSLKAALDELAPDVVVWHLGKTSMLYQSLPGQCKAPVVGVFSSPIYRRQDLTRFGFGKLLRNYNLSGAHLAGILIPARLLRSRPSLKSLQSLVVQTQTTREALEKEGICTRPIRVIPPGVDPVWFTPDPVQTASLRRSLGFRQDAKVLLYFGSPAPLRGLPTLLRALIIARRSLDSLKLVVLNRSKPGEMARENAALKNLLRDRDLYEHVKVISGFLCPRERVCHAAAADIIALPFEILPSDAPLSIMEANALGKPIITTRVACLPELAAAGRSYLADPGSPTSLAGAILEAAANLNANQLVERVPDIADTVFSWERMGREWSHYLQNM